MKYIMVDVEADGPCPGEYSMVSVGAVIVEPQLKRTFLGELKPISEKWVPEALAVSGYSREQTLGFKDPQVVMQEFKDWINKETDGRVRFIADNNGFDWQFVNYYFHRFIGNNPFGFSSSNLGDLYKGMKKNTKESFKGLRRTKHDHNPVNDAIGNAEALLSMQKMGLKM